MPGYALLLISMSLGFGWHRLIEGEYSTARSPPKTAARAQREGAVHVRLLHGIYGPGTRADFSLQLTPNLSR